MLYEIICKKLSNILAWIPSLIVIQFKAHHASFLVLILQENFISIMIHHRAETISMYHTKKFYWNNECNKAVKFYVPTKSLIL